MVDGPDVVSATRMLMVTGGSSTSTASVMLLVAFLGRQSWVSLLESGFNQEHPGAELSASAWMPYYEGT